MMHEYCPGCERGPVQAAHNSRGVYCARPKHARKNFTIFDKLLLAVSGR